MTRFFVVGWVLAGITLGISACAPAPPADPSTREIDVATTREVEVATTVAFTEGPTVDADGNVYFTDLGNSRIMRLSTTGELTTFREESYGANGLIFDSQWRLLACEAGDGEAVLPRVTRTDMRTGEVVVVADHYEGKELHKPNDVTIDGSDRIYFTDRPGPSPTPDQTGVNGVYRVDLDGSIERILTEPDIERPNGLVISPDDDTLYLLETAQGEGGARMIRAYDLSEESTVSNMRVFHDFYPGRSGDGMTIDSEGNLWVAAGLNRLRGTSETLDTRAGVTCFLQRASYSNSLLLPRTRSPTWHSAVTTSRRSTSPPERRCFGSEATPPGREDSRGINSELPQRSFGV